MKVTELRELKLIGLRVTCEGAQYVNEIPKAAIKLGEQLGAIKGVTTPAKMIGTYIVGDYSEEEDGYWVCVEVDMIRDIPDGMVSLTIPPQRYAVIKHEGPIANVSDTYRTLHKWIEENRYERVHRAWHLEISNEWVQEGNEEIEVELYDTIR